jgi:hypothetical protein
LLVYRALARPPRRFALYRLSALVSLHALGLAFDLRVWRNALVNFRFIFEAGFKAVTCIMSDHVDHWK